MDFKEIRENLEKKGYTVSEFDTAKEASEYLNKEIDGKTVGFGGSVTLTEMGVCEELAKHNDIYWHWAPKEGMSMDELREKAMSTEIYLSSVNGISKKGDIVNIDGTGNRVASITFGHKKVYLVVGENKIRDTYEEALFRARNIAAPKNAQRLNRKTPCAVNGDKCYDCDSPERICRILDVLWVKPGGQDVEVVLIHENLGY